MMDFRQVLTKLDEYQAKGIRYLDSGYLSSVMGCSTAQASKRLSRIHGMGFLVREKHRRRCFSKRGKFCYKGYYYEYSLSSQGRKYVEWIRNSRLAREVFYGKMIGEAAAFLSEDEKNALLCLPWLFRLKMRYGGPSRDAQEFGFLMSCALPGLTRKLGEMSAQREQLELDKGSLQFKCDQLQTIVNDQASKINHLEKENEEVLAKAERDAKEKDRQFLKIATNFLSTFIEMSQSLDSATDAISGLSYLTAAQEGIIRNIETCISLASNNPEKTAEFLNLVRSHSPHMNRAKYYLTRSQQKLRELQERKRQDQLKVALPTTA